MQPGSNEPALEAPGVLAQEGRRRILDPINLILVPNLVLLTVARNLGVIADAPLWLLLGSMILAHVGSVAFAARHPMGTSRARPKSFLVVSTGLGGIFLYVTGWGAVFAVALIAAAAVVIDADGSRYGRTAMLAIVTTIAVGEGAVALGIVQSMLPGRLSYGVAFFEAVMALLVIGVIARGQREKEQATEREKQTEERFRALVQYASDAILVVADGGQVLYASPAVEQVLGCPPDSLELFDLTWIDPDHVDAMVEVWIRLRAVPGARASIDVPLRRVDGTSRWVEVHLTNLSDSPAVGGFVCNLRDIGERRVAHDRLEHDAQHDPLTQLPNRRCFHARLEESWRDVTPDDLMAVLFIDVDKFKDVNDHFGHAVGDEILLVVARTLSELVRPDDLIARYGGDEFVVLLRGVRDVETVLEVVDRITSGLAGEFQIHDHDVALSVSVGVSTMRGKAKTVADLVRDADHAMYQAKRGGRARWQSFEELAYAHPDRVEALTAGRAADVSHEPPGGP